MKNYKEINYIGINSELIPWKRINSNLIPLQWYEFQN
jgi:hypothetical protein